MQVRSNTPSQALTFDKPADADFTPPPAATPRPGVVDEEGFRALLDDPEACWQWEGVGLGAA
jgi:hypothetical protein